MSRKFSIMTIGRELPRRADPFLEARLKPELDRLLGKLDKEDPSILAGEKLELHSECVGLEDLQIAMEFGFDDMFEEVELADHLLILAVDMVSDHYLGVYGEKMCNILKKAGHKPTVLRLFDTIMGVCSARKARRVQIIDPRTTEGMVLERVLSTAGMECVEIDGPASGYMMFLLTMALAEKRFSGDPFGPPSKKTVASLMSVAEGSRHSANADLFIIGVDDMNIDQETLAGSRVVSPLAAYAKVVEDWIMEHITTAHKSPPPSK